MEFLTVIHMWIMENRIVCFTKLNFSGIDYDFEIQSSNILFGK